MKKEGAGIFEIDLSKCTGCRACEIAWSFHLLIQTFSATDEEIKSFVCKKENINA